MVHLIKITCSCNTYGLSTHPAIPAPRAGLEGVLGSLCRSCFTLGLPTYSGHVVLQVSVFMPARDCLVRWERLHRYCRQAGAGRGLGGGRPEFTWFSALKP